MKLSRIVSIALFLLGSAGFLLAFPHKEQILYLVSVTLVFVALAGFNESTLFWMCSLVWGIFVNVMVIATIIKALETGNQSLTSSLNTDIFKLFLMALFNSVTVYTGYFLTGLHKNKSNSAKLEVLH